MALNDFSKRTITKVSSSFSLRLSYCPWFPYPIPSPSFQLFQTHIVPRTWGMNGSLQEESQSSPFNLLPGLPIGHRTFDMSASVAESRVEKGEEWLWRGKQKIHSTVLNQCLGLLSDESLILYLFFFLCGRSPDTLSSVLVGKIRFSTNLRFWLWPAKWVVLPFTKAGKKHD